MREVKVILDVLVVDFDKEFVSLKMAEPLDPRHFLVYVGTGTGVCVEVEVKRLFRCVIDGQAKKWRSSYLISRNLHGQVGSVIKVDPQALEKWMEYISRIVFLMDSKSKSSESCARQLPKIYYVIHHVIIMQSR